MIYDCYKDMHLSGDRAFPLKGTYNTLNMSLRHVTRHAGCRSIRRSMWPGIHLPRRSRSRRAYRWKPYRRCWDINISPHPNLRPNHQRQDRTRYDGIERRNSTVFSRSRSNLIFKQFPAGEKDDILRPGRYPANALQIHDRNTYADSQQITCEGNFPMPFF